jgi:hypothetical protein
MNETLLKLKNKLAAVRNMIALANSEDKSLASDDLSKKYFKTQNEILKYSLENTVNLPVNLSGLATELNEWKMIKSTMSDQSYDEKRTASNNIIRISDKIVDELSYDAKSYFQTYFLTNTLGNNLDMSKIFTETFVTELDTFKNWFADSVLEENGKPIVYYHGTRSRHERFDFSMFPGMYFAKNRAYSEYFAGSNGTIMEVYLKVTNPLDLRLFGIKKVKYEEFIAYLELKYGYKLKPIKALQVFSEREKGLYAWQYLRNATDWLNQIKDDGLYDGVVFEENNPALETKNKGYQTPAVMVFSPEQIKTTRGNLTFSSYSKDIRFDKGGKIKKQLSRTDFEKIVKKLEELKLPVTVIFDKNAVTERVTIIDGMDAPESIYDTIWGALNKMGYKDYQYEVVGDSSKLEENKIIIDNGIRRIRGGHKNYYNKGGKIKDKSKLDFYEDYYNNLTPEPYLVNKGDESIEITGFTDEKRLGGFVPEKTARRLFGLGYAMLSKEQKANILDAMVNFADRRYGKQLDEMDQQELLDTLNQARQMT